MATKNLNVEQRVKRALKADNEAFRGVVTGAVSAAGGSDLDRASHQILSGEGGNLRTLPASDVTMRNRLVKGTFEGVLRYLANNEFCSVRIHDCRLDTSANEGLINWKVASRMRSVAAKLGDNSITMMQLVHHPDLRHEDNSILITPELKGVFWAPTLREQIARKLPRLQSKLQSRFGAGPAITIEWFNSVDADCLIQSLAEVFRVASTVTGEMQPIDDLRRFHTLASCRMDKLAFGTGWGKQILDGIFAEEKRRIALAQKDQTLVLHPDAISHYLAGFSKRCTAYPYETLPFMQLR